MKVRATVVTTFVFMLKGLATRNQSPVRVTPRPIMGKYIIKGSINSRLLKAENVSDVNTVKMPNPKVIVGRLTCKGFASELPPKRR